MDSTNGNMPHAERSASVVSLDTYRARRGLAVAPLQVATRFDHEHPVPTHCPICGTRLDLGIVLGRAMSRLRDVRNTRTRAHAALLDRVRYIAQSIEYGLNGVCSAYCETVARERDEPPAAQKRRAARRAKRMHVGA